MLIQFSSVAQSCLTLCDPMDCSTPGFPVPHQLPELAQTRVQPVSDAIQPSHPPSSPFSPTPNLFQHQSLFQRVNSYNDSTLRWPNYWSFSFSISPSNEYSGLISFRMDWVSSACSPRDLRVFSKTTVQKYQFFGSQLSL